MRKLKTAMCAVALLAVLGGTVQAAPFTYSTYSDQASFLAAAGGGAGLAFEDFQGLGNQTSQTLALPGAVFSSTNGYANDLFVAPGGFAPAIATDALFANYVYTPLIVNFTPGVTAVGSDVISWAAGSTITITLWDSDGASYVETTTPSDTMPSYFGLVVSSGQLARLQFTPGYQTVGVDNIHFGQAVSAVPAPGAILLGTLGTGLVGWLRRRRTL